MGNFIPLCGKEILDNCRSGADLSAGIFTRRSFGGMAEIPLGAKRKRENCPLTRPARRLAVGSGTGSYKIGFIGLT